MLFKNNDDFWKNASNKIAYLLPRGKKVPDCDGRNFSSFHPIPIIFLENIIQAMNILWMGYGGQKFLPSQKFLRFGENCHFQNGPNMHPWQRKSRFFEIQPSDAVGDRKTSLKHSTDNFWRKNNFDIFYIYRYIPISKSPNFGKFTQFLTYVFLWLLLTFSK